MKMRKHKHVWILRDRKVRCHTCSQIRRHLTDVPAGDGSLDPLDGRTEPALMIPASAMTLLKESRKCIAACFRTMAGSDDKMIMDRLEMQLTLAGVKDGIGVRLQEFIASNDRAKP